MSDLLKGNFQVRRPIRLEGEAPPKVSEELRGRALASISGSMVYVERTDLTWDGDEDGREEGPPSGADAAASAE